MNPEEIRVDKIIITNRTTLSNMQAMRKVYTIMDMGQIMRSSSNDENIFSTKVISNGNVSNDLSVLRSSMPIPCPPAMYFCD